MGRPRATARPSGSGGYRRRSAGPGEGPEHSCGGCGASRGAGFEATSASGVGSEDRPPAARDTRHQVDAWRRECPQAWGGIRGHHARRQGAGLTHRLPLYPSPPSIALLSRRFESRTEEEKRRIRHRRRHRKVSSRPVADGLSSVASIHRSGHERPLRCTGSARGCPRLQPPGHASRSRWC